MKKTDNIDIKKMITTLKPKEDQTYKATLKEKLLHEHREHSQKKENKFYKPVLFAAGFTIVLIFGFIININYKKTFDTGNIIVSDSFIAQANSFYNEKISNNILYTHTEMLLGKDIERFNELKGSLKGGSYEKHEYAWTDIKNEKRFSIRDVLNQSVNDYYVNYDTNLLSSAKLFFGSLPKTSELSITKDTIKRMSDIELEKNDTKLKVCHDCLYRDIVDLNELAQDKNVKLINEQQIDGRNIVVYEQDNASAIFGASDFYKYQYYFDKNTKQFLKRVTINVLNAEELEVTIDVVREEEWLPRVDYEGYFNLNTASS